MPKKEIKKTTEQKARSKKILWGTTWGTILGGAVTAGIAVPIVQASKKLPTPSPELSSNDSIFKMKGPNGKNIDIKYGDIDKINNSVSENQYIASEIDKHLVDYLYEKEYEASLRYEAIYNANKVGSNTKNLALKSVEKLKEEKTKELDELEKKFQEQYGYDKKWEEKFKAEIAKDAYGKAKTKAEAIEYKVTQAKRADAFRRYNFEINQDFTYTELKNGYIEANSDVFYMYKGKRIDIAKKGDKIPLPFAKQNQNFVLPDEYKKLDDAKKEQQKIPLFVSKSFVFEEKNPEKYLTEWLAKKQLVSSTFTLGAKPDAKDKDKPWTVTKAEILKLFKYAAYGKGKDKILMEMGISRLAKFKGVSPLLNKIDDESIQEAKNDETALKYVSSSDAKAKKFGSEGFQNIKDTISKKDADVYFPLLSKILGDGNIFKYETKNDLFKTLYEKLKELFKSNNELYSSLNEQSHEFSKTDSYDNKYTTLNNQIEKFINAMDDKEFNKIAGEAFRDTFGAQSTNSNEKNKISTIYKVGENFVTVGSSGITIQNLYKLENVEAIKKLILRDLTIKSKANYSDALTDPLLNLETMFKDLLTQNYILNSLLNSQDFVKYIKEKEFTSYDKSSKLKFTDKHIQQAKDYEKSLVESQKASLIKDKANQIKKYIKSQIDGQLNADFKYDSVKGKFWINGHQNDNDIEAFLFNKLKEYVDQN
ncbi:HinT-interacting membrane complex protein P80 [Metamycoplasma buccale]|uniref:HinT-interacting membrane complex protein P80 n=1 Tax=Metamycoplasma buccale TaxID=55602 RepID=UPI00398EB7ED